MRRPAESPDGKSFKNVASNMASNNNVDRPDDRLREVQRLSTLLDVSQALSGTQNLKASLHRVLEILAACRGFAKSLSGVLGALIAGVPARASAQAPASAAAARATGRLTPTKVTRIRLFYPENYDRNGPQAFPQSNFLATFSGTHVVTPRAYQVQVGWTF